MKQSMLSSYLFQDLSKKKGGIIDGFGKKKVPGDATGEENMISLSMNSKRSFCMSMIDGTHSFEEEILLSTMEASTAYATTQSEFKQE